MSEKVFSVPALHKNCIEEIVILNETRDILKYTLSNSLDDIRTAIFSRTGHNVNLGKATWKINPKLSISIKHLMNSHNVNYSMTTEIIDENKSVVVNMRAGDNWFITDYYEIKGKLFNRELISTYFKAVKIAEKILKDYHISSDDDE